MRGRRSPKPRNIAAIIRRRCRCLDGGQMRIEKEYL